MARTAERELDERKARVLGLLRSRGADARSISLSYSALSEALGTTECRMRCSLRALKADGMLAVHARYFPNGGQRENAYRITSRGRRWLARIEEGQAPDGAGNVEEERKGKQ
ncbi:hypothetical protein [Raoultibacter phocaeensis]|uniref:hypothetical protein n=1 Tax=Raoultibacter phocaeensis TaxID=2479841 RepID=UPI00111BCA61|nr:hypothetical protein [Raoultibacter phocaeensis]